MPNSRIFNVTNMSLNTIRENKILAKISEFTVYAVLLHGSGQCLRFRFRKANVLFAFFW